jgi:hypothetical protein
MKPESERVASLRKKLKARTGVPGYEKNCEAIQAEIDRLVAAANGPEFDL